jgi:hypothetical protein
MKTSTKRILITTGIIMGVVVIGFGLLVLALVHLGPGSADYTYQIAGSCKLERSSAYSKYISCDGVDKSIPPDVVSLGWDNRFLIATTNPVTKTDPRNPNCVNCVPDEAVTYWWIVDLNNRTFFGPIQSQEEFIAKESQLDISNIQLWSVEDAKSHGVLLDGELEK